MRSIVATKAADFIVTAYLLYRARNNIVTNNLPEKYYHNKNNITFILHTHTSITFTYIVVWFFIVNR